MKNKLAKDETDPRQGVAVFVRRQLFRQGRKERFFLEGTRFASQL